MFTGLVEEIGEIQSITRSSDHYQIVISASHILDDVHLGDSISVNGVCLTVTTFSNDKFSVDIMPETVKSTNLKDLTKGSKVNLERAMAANGRFGGHFVSGHIDGVGTIVNKKRAHNAVYYQMKVPDELAAFLIHKGSVAVDGTSLTIFDVTESTFTISLIPHTMQKTVLGSKGVGEAVNIECDMLVKYMEQLLSLKHGPSSHTSKSKLSNSFLEEHGFK